MRAIVANLWDGEGLGTSDPARGTGTRGLSHFRDCGQQVAALVGALLLQDLATALKVAGGRTDLAGVVVELE